MIIRHILVMCLALMLADKENKACERCDDRIPKGILEYTVKTMASLVKFGLIHTGTVIREFLRHIILEEIKDKIEPGFHTRQRACLINDRRAALTAEGVIRLTVSEYSSWISLKYGKRTLKIPSFIPIRGRIWRVWFFPLHNSRQYNGSLHGYALTCIIKSK